MENKTKLILTLCGLIPYKAKCLYNLGDAIKLAKGQNDEVRESNLTAENLDFNILYGKPLLHSFNKLTEPILEGGLIPIVELEKEFSGFYFAFTSSQLLAKRRNTNMYFDVNHIGEILEKLKKWHFNIYDLPKEMFIEKSEIFNTTNS